MAECLLCSEGCGCIQAVEVKCYNLGVCILVIFANLLTMAVRKTHFVVPHIFSCCGIKILLSTIGLSPGLFIQR